MLNFTTKLVLKNKVIQLFQHLLKRKCITFTAVFILITQLAAAQVFEVQTAKTDETCPGNGTITLSTLNATEGASVRYRVYLLPDTTSPLFNSTGTLVTGLNDGTYSVIATQDSNGTITTAQTEVVIEDHTIPLVYDVATVNSFCGPDGTMTITASSGTPVGYELLSGPVTRPLQPSNTFTNIPAGNYQVRVTDNCGTAIVVTTRVFSDVSPIIIGPPLFPDVQLPACDLLTVAHDLTPENPDAILQFPLTAVLTLYPPGGADPIVYTQSITQLFRDDPDFYQVIPFYYDTDYYYDFQVTDPCGTTYRTTRNLVRQKLTVSGSAGDAGCPGKFLQLSVNKYVAPYSITFTQVPDPTFVPASFNAQHPGPFTLEVTAYGTAATDNSQGIAVPYGTYRFSVTDSCGRTSTGEVEIVEEEIEPSVATTPANCQIALGSVEITIPAFKIVDASITFAPEEYTTNFPFDVSDNIDDEGTLKMERLLPPGAYVFKIIDECGREFIQDVTIISSSESTFSVNTRPDCTTGNSSVKISPPNAPITSVIITSAPSEFTEALPYDASANINAAGTAFLMNNLPQGSYSFLVDDACRTGMTRTQLLTPYSVSVNNIEITRHCGSFDMLLNHTSTGMSFVSLWLQKKIGPNQWGNPLDNTPYPEGTVPTPENSVAVTNNQTMYSLTYRGEFRIVKRYAAFGTGDPDDNIPESVDCLEVIQDNFSFFDDLLLTSIESLTCSGDIATVRVNVQGVSPMTYKIIKKNGQDMMWDNGQNNVFNGLDSAEYVLEIEDPCGNIIRPLFNVADLPSIVNARQANDLESCDIAGDGIGLFDLSLQTATILGDQDPANFTVTYHATNNDAELGVNALPLNYSTTTGTIYARAVNNSNNICHAISSFTVLVRQKPAISLPDSLYVCEGENIILTADAGYIAYEWSTGSTAQFITVNEAGSYNVTVTDQYGCKNSKTVLVTVSQPPHISYIDISDWNDTNNTISVVVAPSPSLQNFEYSLDNTTYQDSNVFYGLPPGAYTVYVKDRYECGSDNSDVYLLTYPKFFTPNNDGVNDLWRIQFSAAEPHLKVYIYDRYGKVITSFGSAYEGWDGTYNGERLPSTDYWFVVKRENGKEYKGHFSMIR